MRDYGFMSMDFNNLLYFPDFCVWLFLCIHLLVSYFGISGFVGMIFRKFSKFMGIIFRNLSGFMGGTFITEWHNPASWKLK